MQNLQIVADGRKRLKRALEESVQARHASELTKAGFWRPWLLRKLIRQALKRAQISDSSVF
jgi:transposase